LDPVNKAYTSVSAGTRKFRDETTCYYQFVALPSSIENDPFYDWQIDANITLMRGVTATIHNGTSLFSAGNETQVDFDIKKNYTFNATGFNNIFVTFTADGTYSGQSIFMMEVGLRPFNKTYEEDDDDDDDEKIPDPVLEIIPTSKLLSWNERVIIFTILFGLLVTCCFKRA
jgi:hypothetical protein